MSLIDDVKKVCDRLAPLGWRDLILLATGSGLDIRQTSAAKLKAALLAKLQTVDRTVAGFDDLHAAADAGISPGSPARSLFYHALASNRVHPAAADAASPDSYPSLEELDTVENFIYSLAAGRTDLDGTFVAVFAYQYRPARRTTHLRHADFVFSRTGVARVGTAPEHYDRVRRSFLAVPANGAEKVAVLPARYGVFLARRAKPGAAGTVQGGHAGAADSSFVFPVHKLFAGSECLAGRKLTVRFAEFHRNEKLRKMHQLPAVEGGLPTPPGFDITKPPYVRDSKNGKSMVRLKAEGSSVLLIPAPGDALVRLASQKNSVTKAEALVYFVVPPRRTIRGRGTRFAESTMEIPAFGADRLSSEYVNIRHRINPAGPATQQPEDINLLPQAAFEKALNDGGYAAAHFIDDSCDGSIEALVDGLAPGLESMPAFSLVTAPDFFPLADQFEMETDPTIEGVEPLSKGRLPVNPSLPRPSDPAGFAFDRRDVTVTAIVGAAASGPEAPVTASHNDTVSFLPDGASNVFAPGWDTSRSRDNQGAFLTTSGLGSPFPEDAKLCAALASFWPAAAPDNGRTFGNDGWGNQLPMLDEELGFHPAHERVLSGGTASYAGWDGEFGPFFETVAGKTHVNYAAIERSDYVSNALAGSIRISLTAEVQSHELIARHQALDRCLAILEVSSASLCLTVVRKIADWAVSNPGRPELTGPGYVLEFAEMKGAAKAAQTLKRVRKEVRKRHLCQVGKNGVAYRNGTAAFVFIP